MSISRLALAAVLLVGICSAQSNADQFVLDVELEVVSVDVEHRQITLQDLAFDSAMLCSLVFTDNLLGRIEGGRTAWFWLSSGRWELIFLPGLLSVVCQLLFWSRVVVKGHRGTRGTARPIAG